MKPTAPPASSTTQPRWLRLTFLFVVALFAYQTAWAGVELTSLTVTPLGDRVQIVWETAREYDVAAFQLYYRPADQPDATYQPIGGPVQAQGQLDSGAIYQAEFYQLQPSVSYCFRLQEIPSNNEPGDVFERCGYGIGTTPTPTFTPTSPFPPTPTETPIPTQTPFPTETPFPTQPFLIDTPIPPVTGGQEEGGVTVLMQTETPDPAIPPTYVVQTATFTPTPLVILPTPTPLPTVTPTSVFGFLGGGWRGTPDEGSLTGLLVLMLCVGSVGLALLGVATLLGTLFYLRSRR